MKRILILLLSVVIVSQMLMGCSNKTVKIDSEDADYDVTISYDNAIYLELSTTKYNCHSYAWYYASSSNSYWMNNPTSYMVDGSYNQFTNVIEANSSTRLYYINDNHSAVVYASGGPLAGPHKLTVTSKWGELPLMRHVADYSPYNSTGITMWRR